ncbi:uncharacterized protein N7479_000368 [Penicillium vulpinum]|uniref:uncharacterized protein n=1 Tax=Penicillium vulpinum TaxID=29845 RepID=UPI002549B0E5|nr:uncharacterized protein N7479_000368 [Penicillium vulpinum]KAJ5970450.1 hypothetical protein N7479_000368 [Penicillium vulpinum]
MNEAYVGLPHEHIVNLSPRYKAYRVEYKELPATTPPRYMRERRSTEYAIASHASGNMSQLPKATKLPVPRTFAEGRNDASSQMPSPTALPRLTPASHSGRLDDQSTIWDKGHDQYWRKIREKLEDSQLLKRTRSKESDTDIQSPNSRISYHRSRLPASTSQDQASSRAANAPSGIASQSTVNNSFAQGLRNDAPATLAEDSEINWRKQGDQWVNLDFNESTPQKSVRTDTTTDSSPRSHPSISPVSVEDSSITDWEDRFVVNMPTAKDPNPPTMTAQQIAEYQRSIESVFRQGRQMAHPDTLPSRNVSPEIRFMPTEQISQSPGGINTYDGVYEGRRVPSLPRDQRRSSPQPQHNPQPEQHLQLEQPQPTNAPQREAAIRYYSPDEIGYNRISTIWEELPTKAKEKRHPQNADGSFLGCREISGEKNPDEILKFASPDDASLHPFPLDLVSKNRQKVPKEVWKAADRQITHRVGETLVLQEERPQISRNSRPVQCSKPSPMYQDRSCRQNPSPIPRTRSQDSSKENYHPTSKTPERFESLEQHRGDDDVFIITPTITRTGIPTPDKKASSSKPHGLRRPGVPNPTLTAEAVQAVRAKAQMISTPSGLRPGGPNRNIKPPERTLTASQTLPPSSISTAPKDQNDEEDRNHDYVEGRNPEREQKIPPNIIRGFIHTSGLARPPALARSPTNSLTAMLRNRTESLRARAESLRNSSGSPLSANQKQSPNPQPILPSRDNSESSQSERSFQSAEDTPPVSENRSTSPAKIVMAEKKPEENKEPSSRQPARSKPVTKKVTLSVERPSSAKQDKLPTSTRKISGVAKLSKSDKPPKSTKPAASENPPPSKAEKPDPLPKKEERIKQLPRLRTSGRVLEIAELDGLQVVTPKGSLQPNITDVYDLGDINSRDGDESDGQALNPLALSLIFNILIVAVTQVNRALRMGTSSPYTKFLVNNTLNMTRHCWRVSKCIYVAVSRYQATGTWPKARSDQAVSRFMVELLQAIVYLLILGCAAVLIGRTAGYIVLVSSWIVWFARPFAWAFQCVGRALIM